MSLRDLYLDRWKRVRAAGIKIYDNKGLEQAINFINKNLNDPRKIAGLEAELLFYDEYKEKHSLIPTTLMDDMLKCDFAGDYKGGAARFDVTTNPEYKDLSEYESLQEQGEYYIVVVDREGKDFQILDINFPTCSFCEGLEDKKGRLIPIVNISKLGGESVCSSRLRFSRICSYCGKEEQIAYDELLEFSPSSIRYEVEKRFEERLRWAEEERGEEKRKEIEKEYEETLEEELEGYASTIKDFCKNQYGGIPRLVGSPGGKMIHGEVVERFEPFWVHPTIDEFFDPLAISDLVPPRP